MRTALSLALLATTACGAGRSYEPFDADAVDAARAEQAVQGALAELAEGATLDSASTVFTEVITRYDGDLHATVAARTDAHLDVEGWGFADAGATLDREWSFAAGTGRDAADSHDLMRAQELVDKILHVSFYHAVYGGFAARTRAGLDAAFGYVGLVEDGTASAGLAKVAAGREQEFDVELLEGLFTGFLDARDALEEGTAGDEPLGDDAAFDAARDAVDAVLIRTLGLYANHELGEIPEASDEADVKLAEARTVWEGVAPYAAHADSGTADAILGALYPEGGPVRSTTGYLLQGLDAVQDGSTVIDAAGAIDDIGSVLPE